MKAVSFVPPLEDCFNYQPPSKDRHRNNSPDNPFKKWRKEWAAIRARHLEKNPVCEQCRERGIDIKPAYAIDHISPHRGEKKRFLYGKLRSLCKSCHARKSAIEKYRRA